MTDGNALAHYKAGLDRTLRERLDAMERERLDLLERIRPAGHALRALGAKGVFLFGSILRPYYFDRASDIDILVVGLADAFLLRALGTVERATGVREREINIVFDQMAPVELVEHTKKTGLSL